MKKPLSIILSVIFICTACVSSFAQQSRTVQPTGVRGAIAEYESIKAFSDGQGVFMRWEMTSELNNVGFLVCRASETGLELVGRGMIMGSISTTGNRTLYGGTYEIYDPLGTLTTNYVIQNLFL